MTISRPANAPFSVVVKPIGPSCNLNCHYCYYLEKADLFSPNHRFRMSDELLETFTRDYINAHSGISEVTFLWQGGEPTLLGRGFFQKALALQRQYCLPGMKITNALQTNGTLLNKQWTAFLRENEFLVGLSIDGPRRLHDRYRHTRKGKPTFEAVRGALRLLRDEGVEFNTLTTVHHANARHGAEVYRFLRSEGVQFMQFIPIVERQGDAMAPWSVPPQGYGRFMTAIFEEWVRKDVGSIYVRLFDVQLGLVSGYPASLCVFAEGCGSALAMEHNGDLYACDHFVYPSHKLGNIAEQPLRSLAEAPEQLKFGTDKSDLLPRQCRDCDYLFACNGGCPKHRFMPSVDGELTLNYLCPSYRYFFETAGPTLKKMADLLRQGRPASDISGAPARR